MAPPTDPAKESFRLDMRALSNRSDGEVRTELANACFYAPTVTPRATFPELAAVSPT